MRLIRGADFCKWTFKKTGAFWGTTRRFRLTNGYAVLREILNCLVSLLMKKGCCEAAFRFSIGVDCYGGFGYPGTAFGSGGAANLYRAGSLLVKPRREAQQDIQDAQVAQHEGWHACFSHAFAC